MTSHDHDDHEDCMFCMQCGECSESLDEEDLCADCQARNEPPNVPEIPQALNDAQLAAVQKWRQEWAQIISNPDEQIGGADCVDWCIQFYRELELLERETR